MSAYAPGDRPDWTNEVSVGNVQVQTGQDYIGSQQITIPAASSPSYVAGALIQVVPTDLVVSLGNVQLLLKSANGYSYNGVQITPGVQWADGTTGAYATQTSAIAPGVLDTYEVGKALGFPALMNTLQFAVEQNQGTSQLADTVTLYWVAGGSTPTDVAATTFPSAFIVEGLLSGTATEIPALQPNGGQIGLNVVPVLSHGGSAHGTTGGNLVNSAGQSEELRNIGQTHFDSGTLTEGVASSFQLFSPGQAQQYMVDLQLDVFNSTDGRLMVYWTTTSDAGATSPGGVAGGIAGWVADLNLANGGRLTAERRVQGLSNSFQNVWLNFFQSGATTPGIVRGVVAMTGGSVISF